MLVDVVVRVFVAVVHALGRIVFGIEPHPLHGQLVSKIQRGTPDEIRHRLAFFLVEVDTVLLARVVYGREPLLAAWLVLARLTDRVANRVVVGDGILGLVLRVTFVIAGMMLAPAVL